MPRQRKTSSSSKGKIGKKEKEWRKKQEEKLKLDRTDLENIPEFIQDDEMARSEFERITEAAKKLDLWDNLDLAVISIYCNAWSNYNRVTKLIKEHGYTVEGKESQKVAPLVNVQAKYIDQIMKCSSKLGLTVTDRLKLIIPEPETKENKFTKYLKV